MDVVSVAPLGLESTAKSRSGGFAPGFSRSSLRDLCRDLRGRRGGVAGVRVFAAPSHPREGCRTDWGRARTPDPSHPATKRTPNATGRVSFGFIVMRSKCVLPLKRRRPCWSCPNDASAMASSDCRVSKLRPESSATRSANLPRPNSAVNATRSKSVSIPRAVTNEALASRTPSGCGFLIAAGNPWPHGMRLA